MLKLYVGNKNYSSWSMRPWVLLTQAGIAFEEVMIRFDSFAADSRFKATVNTLTPTGKVPVLVDGDLVVHQMPHTLALPKDLVVKGSLRIHPSDAALPWPDRPRVFSGFGHFEGL